jgi:hypothetical protein
MALYGQHTVLQHLQVSMDPLHAPQMMCVWRGVVLLQLLTEEIGQSKKTRLTPVYVQQHAKTQRQSKHRLWSKPRTQLGAAILDNPYYSPRRKFGQK